MLNDEMIIPESIFKDLSRSVRDRLSAMSRGKQEQFLNLYKQRSKKIHIAYLRWIIFPYQHYVYLEENLWMLFYLLSLGGLGIWMIIDLFRIPGLVKSKNRDIAREAIAEVEQTP